MSRKRQSVLIIEDNEFIVELVSKVLKEIGLIVHSIPNIQKGYNAVLKHKPDLIILDRGLPDGDGIDLLRRIKDSERTSHIPVMMLTAENRGGYIKDSLSNGADDYIVKPFQSAKLMARVRNLIGPDTRNKKPEANSLVEEQPAQV